MDVMQNILSKKEQRKKYPVPEANPY